MVFTYTSHSHTQLFLKPSSSKLIPTSHFPSSLRWTPILLPPPLATSRGGWKFHTSPSDDDPPEAGEDSSHGFSKFDQIYLRASRARKREEEDFKKHQDTLLKVLSESEDPSPDADGDDVFNQIDRAIALKREEFVKQGLIKPNVVEEAVLEGVDELQPDEVVDLEEIDRLRGLRVVSTDDDADDGEKAGVVDKGASGAENGNAAPSQLEFEFDLESYGKTKPRILEPKFRMTLAELLDECRLVPVSVLGDLEVEVTGIKHDSRLVSAGDLFVCCVASGADAHLCLSEADKRGAVAVVASEEISIGETMGCKALVIVEDTSAALPALAAGFYRFPSKNMSVIGITGSHGKTSTAYLVKGLYEAMGLRTGMLTSVAHYVFENYKLEPSTLQTDAVLVQNWMAKMLCNGAEAVVMEASAEELASDRCSEVDFDIAVFINLASEHPDLKGTLEESRDAQAKLFARMVDPERHRKVVNIDDPNASYFIAQGNQDVPVVTFAMENKNADVHTLKFQLSLFETQVLVNTPQGILEISSGLLGRFNIYNILAAVAVGIAVGAPLEDIVRGIEEIDAVPGRCELIDEEQAFGVIVDHAQTPDALSRLLDSVRELNPRRIITVIGCPGERDRGKRPIMAKIATEKSDVTMLTSDDPRSEDPLDILDDMLAGVGWTMQDYLNHGDNDYYPPLPNGHRLFLHDIRRVAVRCAVAMGEEGDMVVVAGKGHVTVQIEGDKEEYFDDREECREALQYVDELHRAGIDTSEFPWRLPESH